jgi:small-conductance mechanosensitive channel
MPYQIQPIVQQGQTPADILSQYFVSLYPQLINFLGSILVAVVVFLIGWLIAIVIRLVVEFVLSKIQIKEWFNKVGLGSYIEDFTWEETLDKVLAEIAFWVVLGVFLMTSLDILGLTVLKESVSVILSYIPKAIAGGLILLAGFLFGEITRKLMIGILHGLEKKSANGVSVFIKWVVIIAAFLTALPQWGIDPGVFNLLVMGIVLFLALAGGLAFGLGGQETARDILENIKRRFK